MKKIEKTETVVKIYFQDEAFKFEVPIFNLMEEIECLSMYNEGEILTMYSDTDLYILDYLVNKNILIKNNDNNSYCFISEEKAKELLNIVYKLYYEE